MIDPIYVKLYVCTCVRSMHKKCIIGYQLGDWWLSYWDDYRWFLLYFVIFLNFKLLCVSSNFKNKRGWFIEPKPTTTQLLLLCGKQLVREGIWNFILCWAGEEKDLTLFRWLVNTAKCNENVRERWVLTDSLLSSSPYVSTLLPHPLNRSPRDPLRLKMSSSCRRTLSLHMRQPGSLGS